MDSFMHLINLPFHEAGHIIFSPLGRFMAILGGSLTQVLVPAVCAVVLYFETRDAFGAALCVSWVGENLLDLAPYINDARALQLMLLGGPANAVEGHDWEALLGSLGWLHLDHTLSHAAHLIGATLMVAALAWAAVAAVRLESDDVSWLSRLAPAHRATTARSNLPDSLAALSLHQLHTAVLRPARVGVVVAGRFRVAEAGRGQPVACDREIRHEIHLHRDRARI